MTIEPNNTPLTNDNEEERMLLDKLLSARAELSKMKQAAIIIQGKKNSAEKYLSDIERACLDYMIGNGCVESEHFRLMKREVVDAPDLGAIPEEYLRVKKEADKRKIFAERPHGANWYSIKDNYHVQLRKSKE